MDKGGGVIMQRATSDDRQHAGLVEPLSFIHDTVDGLASVITQNRPYVIT
jgi:hypothetical protein